MIDAAGQSLHSRDSFSCLSPLRFKMRLSLRFPNPRSLLPIRQPNAKILLASCPTPVLSPLLLSCLRSYNKVSSHSRPHPTLVIVSAAVYASYGSNLDAVTPTPKQCFFFYVCVNCRLQKNGTTATVARLVPFVFLSGPVTKLTYSSTPVAPMRTDRRFSY